MRLFGIVFVVLMAIVSTSRADGGFVGPGIHGIPKHGVSPYLGLKHHGNIGFGKYPGAYPIVGIAVFPYPYRYRYAEPHFGRWPERLGYRYGRSYYGDGGYFKTQPYVYAPPAAGTYPQQNVVVVESPPSPVPVPADASSGWTRMADGDYPAAIRMFADESNRQPHAGLPKLGYALSVALGGDLGSGVWAMRRAVAIDPQALNRLYPDTRIAARVAEARALYQQRLSRNGDPDAAFMVASLSYLAGDPYAARAAIDHAVRAGDNAASTQNLLGLLDGGAQVSASGG